MPDWARYWRMDSAPVEAMHAHFTTHVYHRHSHESYSFGVTETGAQAFTCRRARHVSGPGMVMAFNPDDPHDGHAGDDLGFTYRMVHIWPAYYTGILDGPDALPLFREPVIDDPALAGALVRLHTALTGGASLRGGGSLAGGAAVGGASGLARSERLIAAALLLARHASGRVGAEPHDDQAFGSRPGTRVVAGRVRQRIHDGQVTDPGADLTMEDIAVAADCSRYAAYRAFRAVYGMPPSDYQRQLRVRAARRLLAAGVSPAAAAAAAGFADQPHLTRWFRRYYGVTPGAYKAALLRGRPGYDGDEQRAQTRIWARCRVCPNAYSGRL